MEPQYLATFLEYFDSTHARTRRGIQAVPPDRIEWRPSPTHWSAGDLIRHLAALERWMWGETIVGRPSAYPGHGPELASGYEAVTAYWERCVAETRAIIAGLEDRDLLRACRTPANAELPVWKWLRAMLEHEAHHRGQLYLVISLMGATPPRLYGLTSDEVRERSVTG